jgi:hypothetical protein
MYGAASEAVATSDYLRGQEQGMKDAYNAVKQSPAAFNRGRQAGQQAVGEELKQRFDLNQPQQNLGTGVVPVRQPSGTSSPTPTKGVFSGDQTLTDDF